jgi:hypothetical protein
MTNVLRRRPALMVIGDAPAQGCGSLAVNFELRVQSYIPRHQIRTTERP